MKNENLKRYRRAPDYIHRVIGGKHVLISIGENIANFNGYIQLNETAAFLWDRLSEPRSPEELCSSVCEEYDVPEETALADIRGLLENAVENRMVIEDA